jgi:hypothetical protein
MTGLIDISILLIERRNPPKFLLLFPSVNQIMWRRCLSLLKDMWRRCLSLLKERVRRVRRVRRRRRRGVKGERKLYLPLSMLLLL